MAKKNTQLLSSIFLFSAAFIWGISFVAQTEGMDYVGPFTFQAVRFLIGVIVLLPVVIISDLKKRKKADYKEPSDEDKKYLYKSSFICGVVLFIAANIQQYALQFTTAGKGGFITALYILGVPLLGIFSKKRVGFKVWLGVLIAVVGLYFLCINETLSINKGDIILLACAVGFTFHIFFVDRYSDNCNGLKFSVLQFFVAAVLSFVIMFIFEEPKLSGIWKAFIPIFYSGAFSCAGGYTLQIIGQKLSSNPTIDSLMMSFESVFSMLAQAVILADIPTGREIFGCVLMFAAIILAQLPDIKKSKA